MKYSLFLSDLKETSISPTDFRKILKYKNFMKTCPVGDELLNAFGRTDTTRHDIPRPPLFLPAFHLHYSPTQHIIFGYPECTGRRFLPNAWIYQTARCHVPERINKNVITCRFFNQTVNMLTLRGAAHEGSEKKGDAADVTPHISSGQWWQWQTSFYLRCFLCIQAADIFLPMTTSKALPSETVAESADDSKEPAMGSNTVR